MANSATPPSSRLGPGLSLYRIYILNRQDRIADKREWLLASDREALERAEDLSTGEYAAEVWDGARLVARLGGELRLA